MPSNTNKRFGGPEVVGGYDHHQDSAYNPADFIIPASDHLGHGERLHTRVQPQHDRAVGVIVASKRFPFRTKGDFVRWATVRGIEVCERLEPQCGFIAMADAIQDTLRHEIYLQEFTQMVDNLGGVVQTHLSAGGEKEVRKLLTKVLASVDKMTEEFWRKKTRDEIMRRFGQHLETGGKRAGALRFEIEGVE